MSTADFSNELVISWAERFGSPALSERLRAAAETEALTPLAMFMDADLVVKAVMAGLLVASLLAWAIWAGKCLQVRWATGRLRRDYRRLSKAGSLGARLSRRGALGRMQGAAMAELAASQRLNPEGIKERAALELTRIETGAARGMQAGVTVIGSIGSTAPFIGLFGTVWGIMNAFIGIAESGTTNLSVVAPGIAEALLATAIGLVAAIPAVILYNHLSRILSRYRLRLGDAASLVQRHLSRDLDREAMAQAEEAAADALSDWPVGDAPRIAAQ